MAESGFELKGNLPELLQSHRQRLYQWLRKCLIGPETAADFENSAFNLSGRSPLDLYHIGILFPIVKGRAGTDPASEDEIEEEDEDIAQDASEESIHETPKSAARRPRYIPPSSAGFSFFIRGDTIRLQVVPAGVRYESVDEKDSQGRYQPRLWIRKPFVHQAVYLPDFHPPQKRVVCFDRHNVFEDRAEVLVLWRPHDYGWLTTVSLSNLQLFPETVSIENYKKEHNKLSIFETGVECIIEAGDVGSYPKVDRHLLSEEDQELELQYKHRRIYAVGHGAAVDWETLDGRVKKIRIDFLPIVEVPQVSVDCDGLPSEVLALDYLARFPDDPGPVGEGLEAFVNAYEEWVDRQNALADAFTEPERQVADRIVARMNAAVKRMRQGLRVLETDADAARAFGIANLAMYQQMQQHDRMLSNAAKTYRWRPFQLAFLLMVLESTVNEDSLFRDTLDLIWFPTGGGKTEAYLGLIAFLISLRRRRFPTSGGGTAVLMRYTLRLLTKQQFQRAARLICALELLRRQQPEQLGHAPITVGMWVGEALSPNSCAAALEIVTNAAQEGTSSPQKLILVCCPWCGQAFSASGSYLASASRFAFHCVNKDCEFGRDTAGAGWLPCNVVDESLYQEPPSLLISTVDKFARLAWDARAVAFFGLDGNRPPELIIQDELHLITDALGSIAGIYEAALDTILSQRGLYPKYIASTATIRMARQQVRYLYARPVAVFPPPGLSIDDAFFARSVPIDKKPGRLYVGYLAHSLGQRKSLPPLAAGLLAAPEKLFSQDMHQDLLMDAWWTLVVYHGSIKGVGVSHNALNSDVRHFWNLYMAQPPGHDGGDSANRAGDEAQGAPNTGRRSLFWDKVAQLTSVSGPEENADTFSRLEHAYTHPHCLDVLLATNMVSVGLDVPRLAAMVVNGQPLRTAEYIQSTSRVGRGAVPGIVVVNYYREQARSLSHYESFRPYHESFYRFVEPSSVTPFTFQARQRALHAALVIAIRHCCAFLKENQSAGDFDPNAFDVGCVIERLTQRCCRADPSHETDIKNHLLLLVEQWHNEALRCRRERRRLDYQAPASNNATDRLLCNYDDRIQGLWITPQSMRNVENTGLLKLI